ncbi:MAG: peptidylprolyl isomerase [Desulfobacterales bacterium]|nr:peptidylprolyl isomerase [Desulfobacterales bacterium]MDD4072675.1 peptidylprolyl isomerase [Desulfobacterales bacterium]MDD4391784.1 peptidylprolyl isomerase [Desulfobacterales bacterium]
MTYGPAVKQHAHSVWRSPLKHLFKIIVILTILIISGFHQGRAESENPRVRLETRLGHILLELDSKAAPATVSNFLFYVRSGFYDDTIFHRVIPRFMIQGGGFDATLAKRDTDHPILNEADNGLKNLRGTIAMARTTAPHSATSQFFINTVDNDYLNFKAKNRREWGYCVFGRVIDGMDTVNAIEGVPTTSKGGLPNVPSTPVTINKAVIIQE